MGRALRASAIAGLGPQEILAEIEDMAEAMRLCEEE